MNELNPEFNNFFRDSLGSFETAPDCIFEKEWKAQCLQWLAHPNTPKAQKEVSIEKLLDFRDRCGFFYQYRTYFFAAEAIAYFPNSRLGDRIVEQLLQWGYAYFRQTQISWCTVPTELARSARLAVKKTDRRRVISALTHLLHATESRSILARVAYQLGQLDPGNAAAISALILLLQEPHDRGNRARIGYQLAEIAIGNHLAIFRLTQILETSQDSEICRTAISVLGSIAQDNSAAISALTRYIQTTLDRENLRIALNCLGKIAANNPVAISGLLEFLKTTGSNDRDDELCLFAIRSLWQIAPNRASSLEFPISEFERSDNSYLFIKLAESILKIHPDDRWAIDTLFRLVPQVDLEYCNSLDEIALLLFSLPSGKTNVFNFWCQKIAENPLRYLSKPLIYLMQQSADRDDIVPELLAKILSQNSETWTRQTIAIALLEIEPDRAEAIAILAASIDLTQIDRQNDRALFIALKAAAYLLQHPHYKQQSIDTIIELWNFAEIDKLSAESILVALENTEAEIQIQLLTPWLEMAEELKMASTITAQLAQLDIAQVLSHPQRDRIVSKLLQLLQTADCSERETELLSIATHACQLMQPKHFSGAIVSLKLYLESPLDREKPYHCEAAFRILWHCAQTMPYSDFYQAWQFFESCDHNELCY